MQRYSEILRYQEGKRSQHPTPGAAVVVAPPGTPSNAGEQFVVLVDLTPQFPHRSREIRALTTSTYWASSGSIVARLRRALAEANRHLIRTNTDAEPGSKCSGSITCAVFCEEEAFFGQIGAASAFVRQPSGRLEVYPPRDRLLIPLGGSLPPVIHIGYTVMEVGSTMLLATTPAVEAHARERWNVAMAVPRSEEIARQITQAMIESQASGSFVVMRAMPDVTPQPEPHRGLWLFRGRTATPAPRTSRPVASLPPVKKGEPVIAPLPPAPRMPIAPDKESVQPSIQLPTFLQRRMEAHADAGVDEEVARLRQPLQLPQIKPPPLREWFSRLSRKGREERYRERRTTAERARLRHALRTLLPGKVKGVKTRQIPAAPPEKATVMGGLALGLLLIVSFITVTVYMQFGGPARAAQLLAEAQSVRALAYNNQSSDDWHKLLELSTQVMTLDPQSADAGVLKLEAQKAIDAQESAAVLDARPRLDLGTAPTPRRILVSGSWVYVLNTAADEVIGLPMKEDGISPVTEVPTTILKRGQTLQGEVVNNLVDMAWVEPGGNYPDGAVFIYSDGGTIYIYEPALGPGSITRQRIQGNLGPGMVTLMEAFGEKLYLVHRQDNHILTYEPINGIYDTARSYFAVNVAPALQETLDIGIDGRVYLLMGDGSINTYFIGTEDRSFRINNLPDPNMHPLVLAVEPDPDNGMIYLGDPQRARILVLNKRGEFTHQFRFPGDELKQLESLVVSKSPPVLYIIAANRLYVAPLPDFLVD
jgi:hypothetical protein